MRESMNEERILGSCWSVRHALFISVPVIIFILIISPWQLIAFYHTDNPGDTHTHTQHIKEGSLLTSDSCVQLTITPPCWVFAKGNKRESVWFSCSVGRKGGWRGMAAKFINSSDLPVKASAFFFNQTEHKQTQSCANESKWDVTVLLGLIY